LGKINKKGQVSIFVIAGLVILLIMIISLYVVSREREEVYEKEALKEKPSYAGQTELSNYVDACIRPAVLQGLEIIRLQGGYINIPSDVKTMIVKDKEGLQVKNVDGSKRVVVDLNGAGNEVPYWITKDSLSVPSISFMESELAEYVGKELGKCVNNFQLFREQNYDVSYGDISVNVGMEKAVVVNIKFPVTMQRGDVQFVEEDFAYTVPVNMQLIDEMASGLTLYESVYTYLEDHTKSLISLYSSIDENRLPPFGQSDTNLDCSQVSWEKSNVKEMLKGVFKINLPHLKVKGTNFELPETQDVISKGVYESFVYDLFESNFSNIEVNFSYRPGWEFIEYDIKPSLGETLKPHVMRHNKILMVGLICVFDYSFKYTVDYPVLTEVKDSESAWIDPVSNTYFENGGFKFQFLLDSYLCGNQERECTGKPSFEFNGSAAAEELNVNLLPESQFCDIEQRISGDLTVNTFDSVTNVRLPEVDVFYYCGSYQNDCFIGRTDENGVLKSKFPYCINGYMYFTKKDYGEHKKRLTILDKNNRVLNYKISPLKEFNVDARKISVRKYVRDYHETGSLDIQGSISSFVGSEKATITANGPNIISYFYPDPENTPVKLSIGKYNLRISLFGDVDILETDYGDGAVAKGFKGSYMLGTTSIPWDVRKEDLAKDTVMFYALAEYSSSELNPGTWRDIDDGILTDEGMSAELLYRCEVVDINPVSCNYNNCDFVAADGTTTIDFHDNSNNCEKAYQVLIKKEQYQDYVQPRFG